MMRLRVGDTAPDFTLRTQRGVVVSLSAVLAPGDSALIAFPGRLDSAAARQRILWLSRVYSRLRSQVEAPLTLPASPWLEFLVIIPNKQDEAKRYVEEVGTPFYLLCDDDGRVTDRYGVSVRRWFGLRRDTAPAMFFVDGNGVIQSCRLDGWVVDDPAFIGAIEKTIRDLRA
jgi:peroxiredoxin